MTSFTALDGSPVIPRTRADLMKHPTFGGMEGGMDSDNAGNPSVWENHYTCQSCTSEQIDWSDVWSCQCDDTCPNCAASHSPHTSVWIGPGTDQPLNPDYVLWRSLPEAGSPETAQAHHAANSNQLWPHGRDVLKAGTIEQLDAEIRAAGERRETATILAALRAWQAIPDGWKAARFTDIATDGETLEPMTAAEIDDLCERINA